MSKYINPCKIRIDAKYLNDWTSSDTFDKFLDDGEIILFKQDVNESTHHDYPVLKVSPYLYTDGGSAISKLAGIPLSFQQVSSQSNNDIGTIWNRKIDTNGTFIYPLCMPICLSRYGIYERTDVDMTNINVKMVSGEASYTFDIGLLIQPHGYTMQTISATLSNRTGEIRFYHIANANATSASETIKISFVKVQTKIDTASEPDMLDCKWYLTPEVVSYNVYPSVDFDNLKKLKELGFVDYNGTTAETVSSYTILKPMPIMWYMG